MIEKQFHLLGKKRFLPLFICQFLGAFNDNLYKNAVVILITYRLASTLSVNPAIIITIAAGIFILPFFLFSAMAGELADKYDKSYLTKIIKLAEIVIMLIAVAGFKMHSTPLLMLVLFLMGTHSAFFGPIKYGILPQHLNKDELLGGNALISAATFIAILIGTIAGGLLVLQEPYGVYAISIAVVAVAVGGFISSLFIPKAESLVPDLKVNFNFVSSTISSISHVASNRNMFLPLLAISWFWFVGATFLSQIPSFSKLVIKGDESVVTLFLGMFTVGVGIGALLCNRVLKGEVSAKLSPIAALSISLFTFDLFFCSNNIAASPYDYTNARQFLSNIHNWRIAFDFLMISISGGMYAVPLNAMLQTESKDQERSRIIGANNIMNSLFMVISAVLTSVLLAFHFEITEIFLMLGIANLFAAVFVCQLLPYTTLKAILRGILKFLFRVEVIGMENYHKAGKRIVIVPNHISFLDAPLLTMFLPEKVTFAINKYIAELWWVKPGLQLVKAFSMDPTNPLATKYLIDEIKNDNKVVIFPEGRITVTGSLMKIYEGPGMIADRSGAVLLPIRIDGAQYSIFSRIRKKVRVQLFPKITITILPPVPISAPKQIKGRARRKLIGRKLYDVMSDMMFESENTNKTLFQSVIEAAHINGNKHHIMMDIERKPLTFRQMLTKCFVLGKAIAGETQKGELVGVMLPTSNACVLTFFALHAYGRVPAMINFSTGISNMLHSLKASGIKKIYTSRKFIEMAKMEKEAEKLSEVAHVVFLEDLRPKIKIEDKIRGLVQSYFPQRFYKKYCSDVSPNDPAVVLFTSGSEGVPKGVVLSHKNIQSNRAQLAARIDFGPSDIVFNALPIFHSFGLTAGTILPIVSGIKVFFYPTPLHYRIIPEAVYDLNTTILFGTDTFLAGYAKFAHNYDFYNTRYVFAGAERLKPETRKMWAEKFGVRIFEGYGATETSPVICANTPMYNKDGTVGRFLPGVEHYLEKVEGIDEGGRLAVKGPNVMLGYLLAKNPGKITPPSTDRGEGWYDTGDIVTVDEQGFVCIKGRAKRFAKIGGEMVSLTFVEDYISRQWVKGHHAVVTIPDVKKGEQLVLITDMKDLTREMLSHLARDNGIAELFVPRKIMHLDSLPELATGKTDYMSLQKLVDEKEKQN